MLFIEYPAYNYSRTYNVYVRPPVFGASLFLFFFFVARWPATSPPQLPTTMKLYHVNGCTLPVFARSVPVATLWVSLQLPCMKNNTVGGHGTCHSVLSSYHNTLYIYVYIFFFVRPILLLLLLFIILRFLPEVHKMYYNDLFIDIVITRGTSTSTTTSTSNNNNNR